MKSIPDMKLDPELDGKGCILGPGSGAVCQGIKCEDCICDFDNWAAFREELLKKEEE